MGSENHYRWESPRHRVWLDAFEIASITVTRREYAKFLLETGHTEPAGWHEPAFAHPDQPIVGVSWFDAVTYCEWATKSQREIYRLPTEAEWEKACRGGLETAEYAWGDEAPSAVDHLSGEWTGPRAVAQGRPNGYGLFNMGDNVHEWCLDWYAENYYAVSPERNPRGGEFLNRSAANAASETFCHRPSPTLRKTRAPESEKTTKSSKPSLS